MNENIVPQRSHNVTVSVGEDLMIIKKKQKRLNNVPFGQISMGVEEKHMNGINFLLTELTTGEQRVVARLINMRNFENGISIISHKFDSNTEKNAWSLGLRGLIKKGAVIRMSSSRKGLGTKYMVNPEIVMPSEKFYLVVWEKWTDALNKVS